MRKLMLVCAGAVLVVGLSAPSAAGGGNWIDIRDEMDMNAFLAPGQERVASATAYARDPVRLKEDGPYYAYLMKETYGWRLPADDRRLIRLGRLDVDWSRMKAQVAFTVPQVPPGKYLIAFCNIGCTREFGDVDPTGGVHVFGSALEARLMQRINRLDMALETRGYAERRAHGRLRRAADKRVAEVQEDTDGFDYRITGLERALENVREASKPNLPAWVPVGAALLAAAAGFGVGRAHTEYVRRRALDKELQELVTS
jgi:hypothetical protein